MDRTDVAGCLAFDYNELEKATQGFSNSCKLGEGGFGPVFRGKLKFTDVAIKILRNTPKVRQSCYSSTCYISSHVVCMIG